MKRVPVLWPDRHPALLSIPLPPSVRDDVSATPGCGLLPARNHPPNPPGTGVRVRLRIRSMWRKGVQEVTPHQGWSYRPPWVRCACVWMAEEIGRKEGLVVRPPSSTTNSDLTQRLNFQTSVPISPVGHWEKIIVI